MISRVFERNEKRTREKQKQKSWVKSEVNWRKIYWTLIINASECSYNISRVHSWKRYNNRTSFVLIDSLNARLENLFKNEFVPWLSSGRKRERIKEKISNIHTKTKLFSPLTRICSPRCRIMLDVKSIIWRSENFDWSFNNFTSTSTVWTAV